MANTLKLPVGIDDFRKLRESDFYYVDKTRLIERLLYRWSEVTLFTRPRRFGKTLNMSMLRSFFEIGTDKSLFDGLYISSNKELCDGYTGKYPVIFLSLKGRRIFIMGCFLGCCEEAIRTGLSSPIVSRVMASVIF